MTILEKSSREDHAGRSKSLLFQQSCDTLLLALFNLETVLKLTLLSGISFFFLPCRADPAPALISPLILPFHHLTAYSVKS